jgi:hypothetical protein
MTQRHASTEPDLDALALAFVVQVQGSWTPEAVHGWRAQLARHGHAPADSDLEAALARARQQFYEGSAHFFLCMGRPCRQRQKFTTSEAALQQLVDGTPLMLSTTECQGPCKEAPVGTLRIGQRSEMFAEFRQEDDWHTVLDFARRAAAANTLLIDPGAAQPFQFDPVHDHEKVSVPLRKLEFLIGHFQGEGEEVTVTGPSAFVKELIGTWEAVGHCLALRMGVTYPLADGRKDTHTAFVAIGANPTTDHIEARAYTDGGNMHDFHLRFEGETLMFDDKPPGHLGVQRARKLLRPTAYGFEERLEVERSEGRFEPHYVIAMHRVAPTPRRSEGR